MVTADSVENTYIHSVTYECEAIDNTIFNNGEEIFFQMTKNHDEQDISKINKDNFLTDTDKNKIQKINEDIFSSNLMTKNYPDPDIIIRTGGQKRLSNFLLWQSAYSELFAVSYTHLTLPTKA